MKQKIVIVLLVKYIFSIADYYNRHTSDEGIKFIMEREGFVKNIYKDQGNIDTIGYGFTSSCESLIGHKIEDIKDLNEDKGKNILIYLLSHKYENLVSKYDIIYRFNQNQFDALVSFAYNYGGIDKLTNYGTRTVEEISSSLLSNDFMTVNGVKNTGLENRRKLEKSLFDKPLLSNSNKMTINYYEQCGGSFIFSGILKNENNAQKIGEDLHSEENIGIIFYDNQNGNTMKSICSKYYHTDYNFQLLTCSPYYPILEGEYVIKLPKNGIFSNGDTVLPFDLTNIMVDKKIGIYNVTFPLPFYHEYSYNSGLYGNYFFYRAYVSLYDKKETIKSSYQVKVELSFCYNTGSCEIDNNYIIQCNFIKLKTENYNSYMGEYLLKCEGLINTNVYNIPNFGNHIEIRYKIADSSIQRIEVPFHLYSNLRSKSPRDILQVNSIEYKKISDEGINIFRLFGKSKNKKSIRNIGTEKNLNNFNIKFYGGYYNQGIESLCYLFDNNGDFIIECYLNEIYDEKNLIISYVEMENTFINDNNNDYDILLPFGIYGNYIIPGKKMAESNKSSFYHISLLFIKIIFFLII